MAKTVGKSSTSAARLGSTIRPLQTSDKAHTAPDWNRLPAKTKTTTSALYTGTALLLRNR